MKALICVTDCHKKSVRQDIIMELSMLVGEGEGCIEQICVKIPYTIETDGSETIRYTERGKLDEALKPTIEKHKLDKGRFTHDIMEEIFLSDDIEVI